MSSALGWRFGAPVPMSPFCMMSGSRRVPMPWLQTNIAPVLDPVLDRTQRRRAVQRAPRASCRLRGAIGAHLSLRYASKWSFYCTLINIMAHCRPSNNREKLCNNREKLCNNIVIICYNDVIINRGSSGTAWRAFILLLRQCNVIITYYYLIITYYYIVIMMSKIVIMMHYLY